MNKNLIVSPGSEKRVAYLAIDSALRGYEPKQQLICPKKEISCVAQN